MRSPVKRMELYQTIKRDIGRDAYPPGSFLPNELDLAKNYGYARNTVRSVLAMLEDDKIIELLKGKGRRVCSNVQANSASTITFMLPCADFLSDTIELAFSQATRQLLKGVSQKAMEHNCQVRTVPVSPTNNPVDIDLNILNFLEHGSRIVLMTYWYDKLFPILKERNCKVAFVSTQTYHAELYADYLKEWFVLDMNRIAATGMAVEKLLKMNCRRIALVHDNLNEKDHPVLKGYKMALARHGIDDYTWLDSSDIQDVQLPAAIADLYEKNRFDALVLDTYSILKVSTRQLLYRSLGLPESVKIIACDEIYYNKLTIPSLSSLAYPYEKMGQCAVAHLLQEDFHSGCQSFAPEIIERESTGNHYNKTQKLQETIS